MEGGKMLVCLSSLLYICLCLTSACSDDSQPPDVPITRISNAKGAVCLDGSQAAYYHDHGEGEGTDNWVIYLEGGGWCASADSCKRYTKMEVGTSTKLPNKTKLRNILSKSYKTNPDFCSWNRISVHYCDGSSFTGNVEAVNSSTNLTYRGARIFSGIMDDLLAKGMKNAKNAILSGGSAGGLSVILHCDHFRSLLPISARVKCLSDSAYFLHDKYLMGNKLFDAMFEGLINLQGSAPMLPSSCIAKVIKPSLCFFPEYILQGVRTPLFILMSTFDQIQINFNLSPEHEACLLHNNCTMYEMTAIQGLRLELLHALPRSNPSFRGMWVTSCITHGIIERSWAATTLMPIAGNKTYPQVFADWFYDRSAIQVIDMSSVSKNCTEFGIGIY